jgi:hypothetical protein
MKIHEIHDLSNIKAIDILKQGLVNIQEENLKKNYHPDYIETPGNLFYILKQGRYIKGTYYVLENDGEYICSAGWNEYELDTDIALILTRLYTVPKYRTKNYAGIYILPKALEEAKAYKHIWITFNEYNKGMYAWFNRAKLGKYASVGGYTPHILYNKFVPIGKKNIYYTEQYVVELQK